MASRNHISKTSDYYPYGMQMPNSEGEIPSVQPYKFGGKEHLTAAGLNLHDFGPRALYAPAGQFTSADPKCEDYPHLSPYLYCAANPINAVDPTGESIFISNNRLDIQEVVLILCAMQNLTDDRLVLNSTEEGYKVDIDLSNSTSSNEFPIGTNIIRSLINSEKTLLIDFCNLSGYFVRNNGFASRSGSKWDAIINYDDSEDVGILTQSENQTNPSFQGRPSYIGLGHELIHAYNIFNDMSQLRYLNMFHMYINENGQIDGEIIMWEEFITVGFCQFQIQGLMKMQLGRNTILRDV